MGGLGSFALVPVNGRRAPMAVIRLPGKLWENLVDGCNCGPGYGRNSQFQASGGPKAEKSRLTITRVQSRF